MANNTFEAAYMKLKNGMTLFFQDSGARDLIKKLQTAVSLIHEIPAGGTTDQVLKKASNDDFDVEWGAGGGGSGVVNTWYATCSTAAGTAAKVATSATGDFVLATGNMVRVLFSDTNIQTQPTLSVDGSTAKRIKNITTDNNITTNLWRAGEVVDLVYDGTQFVVSDGGLANGTYYGRTKLSNSTSSSSQTTAASSKAVKDTYDAIPSASSATPQDLGTAAAGSSADYSRADHVHNKPTYTKGDVGLGNVDNVQQYSASNPPPYPVSSVNGQTGAVTVHELPSGGTTGQVLSKNSNTDYDASWQSSSGGITFDDVYPVGSIYMSVNSTDPGTLFGGTWERIRDRFLLAAGDSFAAGGMGGEASHKLVESEMPGHSHAMSSVGTLRAISTTTSGATNYIERGSGVYYTATLNNFSTGSKGGNASHNNMPPYLAVYIWKRTA